MRDALVGKLELAAPRLRAQGATDVVLGGSFLSGKAAPGDIDGVVLAPATAAVWREAITPGSPIPKLRRAGDVALDQAPNLDLYRGDWLVDPEVGRSMNSLAGTRGAGVQSGEMMLEVFRHGRDAQEQGVVLLQLA